LELELLYKVANNRRRTASGGHAWAALAGRNLLHERHLEYPPRDANPVTRKILAGLAWRF